MKIDVLPVGQIRANCYFISDDNNVCAVVDPGDDIDRILTHIEQNALKVEWILLTHGHFDHVGDAVNLKNATGAKIVIHQKDAASVMTDPELLVKDGDKITAGALTFTVIETPGHTPGGVCYLTGGELFTGDTLFHDDIGRTDLPGGDFGVMRQTLVTLRDLPYDDLNVWPGHEEGSTLRHERENNMYMKMI